MHMIQPWQKLNTKVLWTGFRRLIGKEFQLPDGKTREFEIKDEGKVVSILALTSNQSVILVKQFRPGPEKVLVEMPGGILDDNELPDVAAARELAEETGYAGNLKFVGEAISDAYSNLIRYVFVATDCKKVSEQKLDDTEFAEVVTMSLREFRDHLRSGQLTDVECGYLGLDALGLL